MKPNLEALLTQLRDRVAASPELSTLNLEQLARPSVRLLTQRVSQAEIGIGESRIGGVPDLPPDVDWPRWLPSKERKDVLGKPWNPQKPAPLGFIAQIDLAEVPEIDDALPGTGWLYFFYDRYCETWGFDPADRGSCRVFYINCDRSVLQRTQPPKDSDSEHLAESCRVEISVQLTLPDDLENSPYPSPLYDAYRELRDEIVEKGGLTHHHLFGYPQLIQNPMELECQLASNGVYCGSPDGYQSAQGKALSEGANDWQLLLQIDSDEEGPGWMWGDVGTIYFWIKRQDLASLQFQDVWLILQCC